MSRARRTIPILVIAVLSASCVDLFKGERPSSHEVDFSIAAPARSLDTAAVQSVVVYGEMSSGGTKRWSLARRPNGGFGATVTVATGKWTFTANALDASGATLFSGSSIADIQGDASVGIQLLPNIGNITIALSLPNGIVDTVAIRAEKTGSTTVSTESAVDPNLATGTLHILNLLEGTWSVTITGRRGTDVFKSIARDVTVQRHGTVTVEADISSRDEAAVTFSEPVGSKTAPIAVALSAPDGYEIYYTTDRTTPAPGSGTTLRYTSPVGLQGEEGRNVSRTLKAVARMAGYVDSPVYTAQYYFTLGGDEVIGQFFWGQWLRMDREEIWYVSDVSVARPASDGSTATRPIVSIEDTVLQTENFNLYRESANVMSLTEDGRKYYLFRHSGPDSSFRGRIVRQVEGASSRALGAISGLAGIDVLIRNIRNDSNTRTVTTNDDGSFIVSSIIPGDTYEILPAYSQAGYHTPQVQVSARSDGEDIGSIVVSPKRYNFKMSYAVDRTYLYADGETYYPLAIRIANIGDEQNLATTYRLAGESGLTLTSTTDTILGTIVPGATKSIDVQVRCAPLVDEYAEKVITLSLSDVEGNAWEDTVSLRFYREATSYQFRSSSAAVNGVLISSDKVATWFSAVPSIETGTWDAIVTLPRLDGYLISLSGATAGMETSTETRYSFAIGREPVGVERLAAFTNVSAFEPNDNETSAQPVAVDDLLISYLHSGDNDFFQLDSDRVSMPIFTTTGQTFDDWTPTTTRLQCSTSGAEIHYTKDGTEPTEASQVYAEDSDIVIDETGYIKAVAFKAGMEASAVAAENYIFPNSIVVGAYERLMPIDQFTTVHFTAETTKWFIMELTAGTYYFSFADINDGTGSETVNVSASLYQGNQSTPISGQTGITSAFTVPRSLSLGAGTYYVKLYSPTAAQLTGDCLVKIHK